MRNADGFPRGGPTVCVHRGRAAWPGPGYDAAFGRDSAGSGRPAVTRGAPSLPPLSHLVTGIRGRRSPSGHGEPGLGDEAVEQGGPGADVGELAVDHPVQMGPAGGGEVVHRTPEVGPYVLRRIEVRGVGRQPVSQAA